jgi:hypothetical protein
MTNECFRFPTSGSHVRWWAFSPGLRSTRCWQLRTAIGGWGAPIMRFC